MSIKVSKDQGLNYYQHFFLVLLDILDKITHLMNIRFMIKKNSNKNIKIIFFSVVSTQVST